MRSVADEAIADARCDRLIRLLDAQGEMVRTQVAGHRRARRIARAWFAVAMLQSAAMIFHFVVVHL